MSKSFNFIIIVAFLMIGLSLIGLSQGSTGGLLEAIDYPNFENFKFGELFTQFTTVFTLGGLISGIALGLLVRQNAESAIKAGAAGLITGWVISDIVGVMNNISANVTGEVAWLGGTLIALFFILGLGFIYAMVSWWAGSDG